MINIGIVEIYKLNFYCWFLNFSTFRYIPLENLTFQQLQLHFHFFGGPQYYYTL